MLACGLPANQWHMGQVGEVSAILSLLLAVPSSAYAAEAPHRLSGYIK